MDELTFWCMFIDPFEQEEAQLDSNGQIMLDLEVILEDD